MLAGREETREVPHEPGQTITFRTLSGRQLDEAEEAQTRRVMQLVQGFDFGNVRAEAQNQEKKPEDSYDKDTLIKYGVKEWSLEEPCNEEWKHRLDAATRDWCVSVILEMNVRPLVNVSGSDVSSSTENSHRNSESLTGSTSPA